MSKRPGLPRQLTASKNGTGAAATSSSYHDLLSAASSSRERLLGDPLIVLLRELLAVSLIAFSTLFLMLPSHSAHREEIGPIWERKSLGSYAISFEQPVRYS